VTIFINKINSEDYQDEHGDYWSVKLDKNTYTNKNRLLVFTYKGNINDLKKIKQISFAKGDENSTQIVNIGDISLKEYLISNGLFDNELNPYHNISFIDFNKLDNKSFNVEFDKNDHISLMGSKILIEINWRYSVDKNLEFKDVIRIKNE